MTIEIETRFLGIPLRREPLDFRTTAKPKKKIPGEILGVDRRARTLNQDHLYLEPDLSVPIYKQRTSFIRTEINQANFRVPGIRFPGITKKVIWKQ